MLLPYLLLSELLTEPKRRIALVDAPERSLSRGGTPFHARSQVAGWPGLADRLAIGWATDVRMPLEQGRKSVKIGRRMPFTASQTTAATSGKYPQARGGMTGGTSSVWSGELRQFQALPRKIRLRPRAGSRWHPPASSQCASRRSDRARLTGRYRPLCGPRDYAD